MPHWDARHIARQPLYVTVCIPEIHRLVFWYLFREYIFLFHSLLSPMFWHFGSLRELYQYIVCREAGRKSQKRGTLVAKSPFPVPYELTYA